MPSVQDIDAKIEQLQRERTKLLKEQADRYRFMAVEALNALHQAKELPPKAAAAFTGKDGKFNPGRVLIGVKRRKANGAAKQPKAEGAVTSALEKAAKG